VPPCTSGSVPLSIWLSTPQPPPPPAPRSPPVPLACSAQSRLPQSETTQVSTATLHRHDHMI
jgi:hypothetical protein